ncbi:MAG: PspA/IM30 family protein [Thermoleophilaceae bacterium]
MSTVFKAKISRLLDKSEDPGETLDYGYQKQVELLQNVKKGIADVVTSKKRLQMQSSKLEQSVVKLDTQARQAMSQGREDLARAALERKTVAQTELQSLDTQINELEAQQEQLTVNEKKLRTKIETFRTKKEVIKAQYSAAEAQVKISEAANGVGEEMADLGLAIQRAEDKTEQMKARAGRRRGARGGRHVRGPRPARRRSGRHRPRAGLPGRRQPGRRRAVQDEGRAGHRRRRLAPDREGEGGRVIVRLSGEGQYNLPDADADRLNQLDNDAVAAVEGGDESAFRELWGQMLELVETDGNPVGEEDLVESDVILPPRDVSFAEAQGEFTGEGLIPD